MRDFVCGVTGTELLGCSRDDMEGGQALSEWTSSNRMNLKEETWEANLLLKMPFSLPCRTCVAGWYPLAILELSESVRQHTWSHFGA